MSLWPGSESLSHHWDWRPEWHQDRACLYWYLTFKPDAVAAAVDVEVLEAVREVPWLDPIPLEWVHLTLCDLGFVDELADDVVDRAFRGLQGSLPALHLAELTLGPLTSMESALVLPVEPLDVLRNLESTLRSVTQTVLGPAHRMVHGHPFRPHVSLGYVNRFVPGDEVVALTGSLDHRHEPLPVEQLVLAAVTRQRRHYQWTVQATLSPVTLSASSR